MCEKADDTFAIIAQISRGMNQIITDEIQNSGAEGLVTSHGAILLCLFEGTKSMQGIAERIHKTPQTVTALVKKLESRGYVTTERSAADKRSTLVALTEQGRALEPLMVTASERLYERQYGGLAPEEITELRRLLKAVLANFAPPERH